SRSWSSCSSSSRLSSRFGHNLTTLETAPSMSVDLRNFDLREGDLLAGKFRVERLLGSGGMGVVVEATHVTLKDRVALKFLRSPKFADQTTITRFLREAQAAARIKSPHVARGLDVGPLDAGS